MRPVRSGCRGLLIIVAALVAIAMVSPGFAQSTGSVKGKVVDAKDQPIEKAKVTIEFREGVTRKFDVTTNRRGEYIQIGLPPGLYLVTAEKDRLTQAFEVRVRLGDASEQNFKLAPGSSSGASKEDAARNEAIKGLFDQGVALSRAGDHDGAVAKFNEAIKLLPDCYDCYYNIGYAYTQKKEYDQAEAAFLKAIEMKVDYVEAYNGLATVYNAQRKFEKAQEASAKAGELAAAIAVAQPGGGGTAGVDALYNQGVIAWNAGKAEDAQKWFQEALKANPDHADSHFQLGMTFVNQNKLAEAVAEFEAYLKLAPEGQYAAQAKAMVATLKK